MALSGIRFAPSPTGRFHLGNLRTAWISNELANRWEQPWIVRFEDIDRPRVIEGARESQLGDLYEISLYPRQALLQSESRGIHWSLLIQALAKNLIYPCACSRKEVQEEVDRSASAPHRAPQEYSGHCRQLSLEQVMAQAREAGRKEIGWRFKRGSETGTLDPVIARIPTDLIPSQGIQPPEAFTPSYHWACGIDDIMGGFAMIVRASDLRGSLDIQRDIQSGLFPDQHKPSVFHTAMVTKDDGSRLEKRTKGITILELKSRGMDEHQIVDRFRKSFKTALPEKFPAMGTVIDEIPAQLTLKELGFEGVE